MLTSLPDPDDLIRAALHTLESGRACTDLATIEVGTERGIASHRVGANAVVSVLARTSDGFSFHQANVFLSADESGRVQVPQSVDGTIWEHEVLDRHAVGPARNVSAGGSGQGPSVGHGDAVPVFPSLMWTWVSGIAPRGVVTVSAASTVAAATNAVVAETGAFVVLLEAPWAEAVTYWGTAEDGAVVALDPTVDRRPGHEPPADGTAGRA